MSHNQFSNNGFLVPCGVIQCPPVGTPLMCTTINPNVRIRWTTELHKVFVAAVERLGGASYAKPTAIIQAMEKKGVFGLTLHQAKSHLQKYRNTQGRDVAGELYEDTDDESKETEHDESKETEDDETLSTLMVPTLGTRAQGVDIGEASQIQVGKGILEEMEGKDPMQLLKGVTDNYVEILSEDPYDKAIRDFFNA